MAPTRERTTIVAALFAAALIAMLATPATAAVTSADISPSWQARPTDTFSASWTLSATLTSTHSMTFAFGNGQGITYHNLGSGTHHRFPGHNFGVWCGPPGSVTYTQQLSFTGSSVSASSQTQLTKSGSWC